MIQINLLFLPTLNQYHTTEYLLRIFEFCVLYLVRHIVLVCETNRILSTNFNIKHNLFQMLKLRASVYNIVGTHILYG